MEGGGRKERRGPERGREEGGGRRAARERSRAGDGVPGRLRRLCPVLSEAQASEALEEWRPALRSVGTYAAHVFLRLPLNAWPTDARMHPAEGTRVCLFGCHGSQDDLAHYVSCGKLWRPILERLRMDRQPSWESHLGLVGDPVQRVAAVRAWLAAFRCYIVVRRGDGVSPGAAAVAAIDHAKSRVPAHVGLPARPKAGARARARNRA